MMIAVMEKIADFDVWNASVILVHAGRVCQTVSWKQQLCEEFGKSVLSIHKYK